MQIICKLKQQFHRRTSFVGRKHTAGVLRLAALAMACTHGRPQAWATGALVPPLESLFVH